MGQRCFEPAVPTQPSPTGNAPYVVMMPPPNVTAVLHMGHGLNNSIQDVLVRFERMRGRQALWLPGTDHAGIATQNVVEKLRRQGGEDPLRPRPRGVRAPGLGASSEKTGGEILDQLKAIGSSADWSRTYFTLDDDLSRAVREVFVRLHEKGLIYRGKYIINWCPRCLTALSNEEAEKEEIDGRPLALRYPLADGSGYDHRRHHPAGDDARRHGGGGASRRPALHRAWSAARCCCRSSTARSRSSPTRRSTRSSAPAPSR